MFIGGLYPAWNNVCNRFERIILALVILGKTPVLRTVNFKGDIQFRPHPINRIPNLCHVFGVVYQLFNAPAYDAELILVHLPKLIPL